MAAKQFFLPYQNATVSGLAEPGARVYFYATGTTTPQNVFTTSALTIPLANPVISNGVGHFVPIYMDSALTYRIVVTDRDGVVLDDLDPYIPGLQGYELGYGTRALLAAVTAPANKQIAYLGEASREGRFVFSTSNLSTQVTADPQQGIYVAPSSDTTGASGAWVRKFDGAHNVKWFGATGDGATNDGASVLAAVAYLGATSQSGFGYSSSASELFFPKGHYFMGTNTIDLTYTTILTGEGTGQAGGASSLLRWSAGATGIRTQRHNTTGATAVQGSVGHGGDGSIIRNLYLKGGFTTTEAEFHGIQLRATATIEDVFIELFQGDAIYIKASLGGGAGSEGGANLFQINRVFTQFCRNGIYTEGADANAAAINSFSAIACRQFGVIEKGFLGNTYNAPHVANCSRGTFNTGGASNPASFVTQGGNQYVCIRGQEAGASTNAPTGAATNNTWWIYIGAGGVDASSGVVAWTSGFTFRAGGAYLTEGLANTTTLLNPYGEIDQYSQFDQNTTIAGNGLLGAHIKVSSGVALANRLGSMGASLSGIRFNGTVEALGDANLKSANNFFGPSTGPAADTEVSFYNTNSVSVLKGYNWPAGTSKGEIWLSYTGFNGNLYRATAKHRFDIGISEVVGIDATGINMANGTGLLFNGTAITSTANGRVLAAGFPILTGDVTTPGGSLATTIANGAVNLAKMANLAATSIIGNNTGGAATPVAITLAGGLSFSGTTITPTGGALAPASVAATGVITSSGATSGIGYATGAGGTVTQVTSRTTTVTINKVCGAITLVSAAGSAAFQSFSVSNTAVAATDTIVVNQKSGTDKYQIFVTNVAASGFQITFATTGGVTVETPVFNFSVIKAVTA